ncbi:MAG: hypothetical protein O7E54_10000 [Planctomycetota bacterium]|nr:hypothetical protein [Planctomycetota bacterium]
MRKVLAAAAFALTFLPGATLPAEAPRTQPAPQQGKGGYHENARYGFKFKAPKGWSHIALKTNEAWLAAKYMSDKSYFYTNKDTQWTTDQTPEMMVIAFVEENMKKRFEEEDLEDGKAGKTKIIRIYNPYKDYDDFLERTYSGGGWHIEEQKKTKVGDLEVTKYLIKVEKLANAPKHIVTWIYHTDEIDFAMQTEILQSKHKKLIKTIERAYRSFKLIPRTEGGLPTSGKTDDFFTFSRLTEGTPKERRTQRMESQDQFHRRAIDSLPDDWDHTKYGDHVLVLNHGNDKWAKRVGQHVVVFYKWLEKTFPTIGSGEYVRAPVIRICKNREEEFSLGRGARAGGNFYVISMRDPEIITSKDDTGWIGYEMGWVNRMLFMHWLQDRDAKLSWAMPQWLGGGLSDYIAGARADGKKLDFRVDDWDRDDARLAVSQGRATPPREMMKFTREEFRSSGAGADGMLYWNRRNQCSMLVRFLMSKEAARCKPAKTLLQDYLANLSAAVKELEEKKGEGGAKAKPKTEEEEEAAVKVQAERWRKREKELIEDAYFRTFKGWSERDWKTFEKAYFNFIS